MPLLLLGMELLILQSIIILIAHGECTGTVIPTSWGPESLDQSTTAWGGVSTVASTKN